MTWETLVRQNQQVNDFEKVPIFTPISKYLTDYSTQHYCQAEFSFKLFGNGKQKGPSENYEPVRNSWNIWQSVYSAKLVTLRAT